MERGEETVTDFGIVALTFDVGGTLIDWHGTIRQELALLGEKRGFERDWGEVTNSWTWSAIRAVQKQKPPAVVNLDAFYRATLDDTLVKFGLVGVTDAEKSTLATAWHKLAAWPDAPAGHARLRRSSLLRRSPSKPCPSLSTCLARLRFIGIALLLARCWVATSPIRWPISARRSFWCSGPIRYSWSPHTMATSSPPRPKGSAPRSSHVRWSRGLHQHRLRSQIRMRRPIRPSKS